MLCMYVNQKTDLNVLLQTDVLSIFEILYNLVIMYTYICTVRHKVFFPDPPKMV